MSGEKTKRQSQRKKERSEKRTGVRAKAEIRPERLPPGLDVPVGVDEAARGFAVIDLHRPFLAATQNARSSCVSFGAGSFRQS